jgi:hypothetical protein
VGKDVVLLARLGEGLNVQERRADEARLVASGGGGSGRYLAWAVKVRSSVSSAANLWNRMRLLIGLSVAEAVQDLPPSSSEHLRSAVGGPRSGRVSLSGRMRAMTAAETAYRRQLPGEDLNMPLLGTCSG